MAVNICLSPHIIKGLALLGRFRTVRCLHTTCQNPKLSHSVHGSFTRCRSIGVTSSVNWCNGNVLDANSIRKSSMTELPSRTFSSQRLGSMDEALGQVRLSGSCSQRIGSIICSETWIRHSGEVRGCQLSNQVRLLHLGQQRLAGHNKWSKVKHIKGPKDAQRSLLYNKLILQMKLAIREGGPNPDVNSALASLISKAKSITMPKATIEGIIKNSVKKGSGADADIQLVLEARGPGQACLLIEILTDNAKRTRMEVQRILQKNGGDFGTSLYAFKRKGVVRVQPQSEGQEEPLTLDLATEVAIEVGAEDVQETSSDDDAPLFMFICDMGDLRTVRNNLTSLNYLVESSSFEYLPETTIALSDANLEGAFHLISLLNDNGSVVKIYDNVEAS